jgi:adhesin/invasin
MGNQVQTATINQQPGPPQVTVSANPDRVFVRLAGAQYQVLPQQSQITVKVADENGNPYPNASVLLTLETETGPTGSLTAAMGRTDSQGQFVTTYQSPSQVPSLKNDGTGVVKVKASATTARNGNVTDELDLTILPGPPALVSLSADKLFVPANETTTLTAQVVDENGNKVRDGVVVAFRQISGPTDVSITPENGGRVVDGQAKATLKAGTTSGAVVVEAKAEQVENGNRFEAVAQITVNVATTQPPVIVESLQVSPERVVVSNSNAVDPTQRQPLDPARPNKATATVVVLDKNNNRPVAGILVVFKVEGSGNALLVSGSNRAMGQPLTVTTDQNGRAQVEIYSPMEAGQVTVKASVDSSFPTDPEKTKSASLTFEPGLPLLQLAVNPDEVTVRLSNEEATVTVSIKDANGNGFANQTVQLQVDVGLLQRQVTGTSLTVQTDGNGEVQVTYIPPLTVPANGQATITAQGTVNGRNLSASVVVRVRPGPPAEIQVVANPSSLPNDGRSEAVITANVRDANGNAVRDGTAVTFELPQNSKAKWLPTLGTSITVGTVNGQAQARLRAGTEAEAPTITVTADSVTETITLPIGVVLQPIQVSDANLFVSKVVNNQYTSFGVNYPNEAEVTVTVNPAIPDVKVVLSASDSGSRWKVNGELKNSNTVDLTTGSDGKAKATYVASTRAGQVTIEARMGNQVQTATINQQPGPPQVTVSANPESVFVRLAGAQYQFLPQQSQITVKVTDENGNPHPNAAVLLTTTGGTLAASSGQTDSQGQFTTTLTAPTQVPAGGKVTVTANVTTTRGERPDPQTKDVAVQPGPPAIVELSATKLTLSETDSATITATVKDANGNPVPSGNGRTVSVTFTLQVSQANQDKVTLAPTSGTTNNNGQVPTTLTTNNAVADTARVTAEAVEVLQSTFFRASNQLVIPVGITATLTDLQIATQTLVVSNSNVADPTQRQPLEPAKQNRTLVTVKVSLSSAATSDVSIPVLLLSSDDNTLWQDVANTSRFALKQLTLFVAIPSGQNQGTAQAFFYTSTKRALNIAGEPAIAIRATLDPNLTDFSQPDQAGISITKSGANGIIQQPGPPATIALDFLGFARAADNVPYLTVNPSNPPTGNITATVRDAVGNPVNGITVNFALSPTNLGSDAGTFTDSNNQTSTGTTDNNGQVTKTLQASNLTTEVTLQVQSGSASATQPIRYSIALSALNITPNPTTIPDDGTTTSLITITGTPNLPNNLKFRLSADLGATLSEDRQTYQPSLTLTVGDGQPSGEGTNEAQAFLKGPNPDLSQTQPRTITLTANLIVDGLPRTFTQTVTLNPRIQITSDFGLSNNPNRLVVSSSNDTDQTRRVPLDTVAGHNKATIIVTLNGSATPNPSFVTFTSNDPNILFVEVDPSNNQEKDNKALGNLSVNFVPIRQDSNIVGWQVVVNLYASTTATSNLVVQIGVLGVTRSIIFEQVPGLPAIVTVSPDRSVIGVTGHPTLPTSTTVRAIIRDAAGNLVTQPGVTVTFTADAGTLNPTSASAVNGVATTTLTSTNATRQVRVIARATAGNAEAVGAATIVFAVGGVSNITLTTDKPQDAQGRVLLDPNDLVRITATFSRTGSVPDGTIPIVTLTGAYGIIQSITPAQSDRSDVIVLNNNTTNVDQEARIRFTVYNEQGLPVSSPEQIVIMKGVTVTPVISLTANRTILKVSTSNDTNEDNRNALDPGGPSLPIDDPFNPANRTTLTVTLNITGLNPNEQVTLTLSSTDLNGLFTVTAAQNGETGPLGRMDINLNADDSGNLNTTVQRAYWASTKAGNFVITAEVKRQNGTVIGRASLNITQNPGNPAQVFLTTDPPRLAVSTVTTEPTAARVIATLFDANNNPVPNWWTFFQLQPVPVNMNPDFTDGESIGIPSVSDGVLDPFAVRTDAGGVAVSLIRSINTCQPVSIRAIADANNNGNLESGDADPDINRAYNSYDTVYYVPLTNASAVVDYNSVTRDIIVTVTPATALPPNTAIWVCRYAVAGYAVDNDGDGRFDEDPTQNGTDEDGDGRDGEDGPDTISPRYYRVTVTEPGRLVVPAFPLGVREIGIVNVRIFIYTKDGTMLRIRIDRVQRP